MYIQSTVGNVFVKMAKRKAKGKQARSSASALIAARNPTESKQQSRLQSEQSSIALLAE